MLPEQYLLDKVLINQLFAKKQQKYLTGEKPAEQRIINACDLMEPTLFIRPSLCDQKMEVGMKIYSAPKRLYYSNNGW